MRKPRTIHTVQDIAKDFHDSMQELADKGNLTISAKVEGEEWHTIAKPSNDSNQPKTNLMSTKKETLNLKCTLTDEEMLDISKEMSEHINKKKEAEDNLAAFKAQINSEIKGHEAHINRAATLIQAGYEYRNILCDVKIDESANAVYWIRTDTNEIVNRESPIPVRYSQPEIPLEDME